MTHKLQSPLGPMTGSKSLIQELAEIFPISSTIQSQQSTTWESLRDAHPNVYYAPYSYIYWSSGGGQNTYWRENRDIERHLGPFDYIGPFLLSGRLGFDEVVEQILRDVHAPHLVSPSDHETWQSWTQNKALYSEVQQRYTGDVALPSPDFRRQHATRPKQNRRELLKMQNWDNAINALPENPTGVSPFQDIRRIIAVNPEQRGQTIIKASRDQKHWVGQWVAHWPWNQPTKNGQYVSHKVVPAFLSTVTHRTLQPVLEALYQTLLEEIQRTGSTHWPNIGKFTVRHQKNRKYIAIQATKPLRSYINKESDELPGEKAPVQGVKFWVRAGRSSTTNGFHALSKQRQLSVHIANKTSISLEQVHGALVFIQKVVALYLRNIGQCRVTNIGTFSTSDRNGRKIVRFKPHPKFKFWNK